MRQDVLEIAIVGDELEGALVADPLHAGHVIRGVADQGQEIGDAIRRHAQTLGRVRLDHPAHFIDGRGDRPGRR